MFQDRELGRLVLMFPDLEFFQVAAVRDILAAVLFDHNKVRQQRIITCPTLNNKLKYRDWQESN